MKNNFKKPLVAIIELSNDEIISTSVTVNGNDEADLNEGNPVNPF